MPPTVETIGEVKHDKCAKGEESDKQKEAKGKEREEESHALLLPPDEVLSFFVSVADRVHGIEGPRGAALEVTQLGIHVLVLDIVVLVDLLNFPLLFS